MLSLRLLRLLGWRFLQQMGRMRRIGAETVRGFYLTHTLSALLNVGLLDEMARRSAVDVDAFAAERGLDAGILHSLCDYLYALGFLERTPRGYTLAADGQLVQGALRGAYHIVYAYEDLFHNLEALLRREKVYGVDVHRRAEFVARGSGAVGQMLAFPMLADAIRRRRFQSILDLGCGDAAFLIDLCQREPGVRGVGLDIAPEAIALGRQRVAERALDGRIDLRIGDIADLVTLQDELPAIDAATSVYVLHEFQDRIVEILQRFRTAFAGMPLLVCEVIRHTPEELRRRPGNISEIQLFHELSNQRLLTRAEWRERFAQAGFSHIDEDYLKPVRTCIYQVQ